MKQLCRLVITVEEDDDGLFCQTAVFKNEPWQHSNGGWRNGETLSTTTFTIKIHETPRLFAAAQHIVAVGTSFMSWSIHTLVRYSRAGLC